MIGYLFSAIYWLVAAAPLICLALLASRLVRGTALPEAGLWGIYLGCLAWVPLLAAHAAIYPGWKAFLGFPLFFGAGLGAIWRLQSAPRRSGASILSEAGAYAFVGLLAYVALGGGYYDRLFQIPHARKMLERSGVREGDASGLARALAHDDLYVRWGAVLAMKRLGVSDVDVSALAHLYKTESNENIKRDVLVAVSKLNISTTQWRQELDAP